MTANSMAETLWNGLTKPRGSDKINGRRVSGFSPESPVYAALDGASARHVLVRVPEDTEPVAVRETRGLRVNTDRFVVGDNPETLYIDLACADGGLVKTFGVFAEDLLRSLKMRAGDPRSVVLETLTRWRAFWAVRATKLSREEALGLFGELWFLRRWITPLSADTLSGWQATASARHDFQWETASVEVKASASGSINGPAHRIATLDQLDDPEEGQLYLFSLQAVDDALAANSLPALVGALTEELRGESEALVLFNEKLAAYGYRPDDAAAYDRRLRVVAERLYRVEDGFPRLTRNSFVPALPPGIGDVTYTLETSACEPWLVATAPPAEGRGVFGL